MARQRTFGRQCRFESLENRRLLAGDVTAQIVHGNLVIKGDSSDNVIAITSPVVGSITITGTDTTVNSSANLVTLTDFTGSIKVKMKGGNDNVTMTGLTSTGLDAEMGKGNDTLEIQTCTVNGESELEGGRGSDTISIGTTDGSTFNGKLEIELGKGVDTLTFQDSKVTGKAEIEGGKGVDTVNITGTNPGDATFDTLNVKLGKGNDMLSISNTTVSTKTHLNGGRRTNTFTDGGGNTLNGLTQKNFA